MLEMDATNIPKITIHNHLTKMEYVNRCEVWIPQLLIETDFMNCVFTYDFLLQRHGRNPFLKRLDWRLDLDFVSKYSSKTHDLRTINLQLRTLDFIQRKFFYW